MFEAYRVATRIEAIDATGGTILRIAGQLNKANKEAGGLLSTLRAIGAELGKNHTGWAERAANDFRNATKAANDYHRAARGGGSGSSGGGFGSFAGGIALASAAGRDGYSGGYGGGGNNVVPLRLTGPGGGNGGGMTQAAGWPSDFGAGRGGGNGGGNGGGGSGGAMGSIGAMMAGSQMASYGREGLAMLSAPVDAAIDREQAENRLRALNLGTGTTNDLLGMAKQLSTTTKGLSYTEAVKLMTETQGITANAEHTKELAPGLAKMKFAISAYMGEGHGEAAEDQLQALVKVMEMRGLMRNFTSGNAAKLEDLFTKSYVASGGMVKPEDFLNMMKTGGIASKSIDTDFMYAIGHIMQEKGGSRAGTALMSSYQNLVAGRSTQQVAERLNQLGLLDKGALKYGTTGHLKKIDPGALKDTEKFIANPFQFLNENILPAIAAHDKIDINDPKNTQKVLMRLNGLFGQRTGADLFGSMFMEHDQINAYTKQVEHVKGVGGMYAQGENSTYGNLLEYHKQMNDLQSTLGKDILPMLNKGLKELIPYMQSAVTFIGNHGTLTKGLIIVFAGVSALASVAGSVVALGGAFSMIAGVVSGGGLAVAIGAVGTAMTALAPAAAAVLATVAAYNLSDKYLTNTKVGDAIGSGVAHTLAFFGNKEAQDAVDQNNKSALTGGPAYGKSGAGKTANITVPVQIDGREVGRAVTSYQFGQMSKPQAGTSYLDTSRGAQPIGYTGTK